MEGQLVKGLPDFTKRVSARGTTFATGSVTWSKKKTQGEGWINGNKQFICFNHDTVNFLETHIHESLTIECEDIGLNEYTDKKTGEVKVSEQFVIKSARLADS